MNTKRIAAGIGLSAVALSITTATQANAWGGTYSPRPAPTISKYNNYGSGTQTNNVTATVNKTYNSTPTVNKTVTVTVDKSAQTNTNTVTASLTNVHTGGDGSTNSPSPSNVVSTVSPTNNLTVTINN